MGVAVDVKVGADGVIYGGVAGTPLPVTTSASLNAAFKDLGDISDAGVKQSVNQSTSDIKIWSGSTVRRVQTDHTLTIQFVALETNPNALAAYYGTANFDDVNNVASITATQNERKSWVIDVLDGTDKFRIVVPDGEVTTHGDVIYKNDQAIGYDITLTCYADGSGVKAYIYMSVPGVS